MVKVTSAAIVGVGTDHARRAEEWRQEARRAQGSKEILVAHVLQVHTEELKKAVASRWFRSAEETKFLEQLLHAISGRLTSKAEMAAVAAPATFSDKVEKYRLAWEKKFGTLFALAGLTGISGVYGLYGALSKLSDLTKRFFPTSKGLSPSGQAWRNLQQTRYELFPREGHEIPTRFEGRNSRFTTPDTPFALKKFGADDFYERYVKGRPQGATLQDWLKWKEESDIKGYEAANDLAANPSLAGTARGLELQRRIDEADRRWFQSPAEQFQDVVRDPVSRPVVDEYAAAMEPAAPATTSWLPLLLGGLAMAGLAWVAWKNYRTINDQPPPPRPVARDEDFWVEVNTVAHSQQEALQELGVYFDFDKKEFQALPDEVLDTMRAKLPGHSARHLSPVNVRATLRLLQGLQNKVFVPVTHRCYIVNKAEAAKSAIVLTRSAGGRARSRVIVPRKDHRRRGHSRAVVRRHKP